MCIHCTEGSEGDAHSTCYLCGESYLWMVMFTVTEAGKRYVLCSTCHYITKGSWPK